jgi:membrane fusion protein, heavy metal efflux system
MFVTAQLGLRAMREMVVVPTSAVQQMDGGPVVFVRTAGGTYHRRPIDHGTEVDGLVEIRSGVRAGEEVVVAGAFLLKSTMTDGGDPE